MDKLRAIVNGPLQGAVVGRFVRRRRAGGIVQVFPLDFAAKVDQEDSVGRVAEWFKAPVLKTGRRATVS